MYGLKSTVRRSAAWTILRDWTFRSRRPAFALWMTRAKYCSGSERLPANLVSSAASALIPTHRFERIGLEAGPLLQWLYGALAEAELPVVCVETRQMQAVLKAQIKQDGPLFGC